MISTPSYPAIFENLAQFTKSRIVLFIPDLVNLKGLKGVIGDLILEGATLKGW
jgi:hypothetical protein